MTDNAELLFRLAREKQLERSRSLSTAWASMLTRYEFEWFVTFTFRERIHPEAADKLFRVWVVQLNKAIYGNRFYRHRLKGVYWARGLEWQKRGVLHYHALIGGCASQDVHWWETRWLSLDKRCGFPKIELIKKPEQAAAYIAKYCAKEGEVDVSSNLASNHPANQRKVL